MAPISSPRRRRRLAWGAGLGSLLAGLIALGVFWPNTAQEVPQVREPGRVQVYHAPKTVKLTSESRAKALTTAANFVKTAVARRNIDQSWPLASASLKQGFTRREWRKGEIPVIPYPVGQAKWKLDYTYADAVGLQVLVYPSAGSTMRPNLFLMELKPAGDPAHRRWVVDSWTPSGVANPALQAPASAGSGREGSFGVGSLNPTVVGEGKSRLGAAWLFAPLALFAIVPAVLLVFAVRSWRRSRRAERAYRLHAERRAGSSPPGAS
jgi:hypothetical protein